MDYLALARTIDAEFGELWVAGRADTRQVTVLERALESSLPPSYREFLLTVGAMSVGDNTISGIIDAEPLSRSGGSCFGDTFLAREEQHLPTNLIVIGSDPDAPYCLDLLSRAADGECAVVCYEVFNDHYAPVARSFENWFRMFFAYDAD